jgi:hypothetical protein
MPARRAVLSSVGPAKEEARRRRKSDAGNSLRRLSLRNTQFPNKTGCFRQKRVGTEAPGMPNESKPPQWQAPSTGRPSGRYHLFRRASQLEQIARLN